MTEQVKKILMVAYVFPPIPYAGTFRSLRLCKGFQKRGVETHVLTINEYDDIPNDYQLLETIPPQVTIHRTPIIDPWRLFKSWKKRHQNMRGFRYLDKSISLFLWFLSLPDHMVLWVPFAVVRGMQIIREHGIQTVYVSSPPHSTQLIGCLLKKFTGIRLIADFRDPIVGNVYDMSFKGTSLRSRIESRLKTSLERLIVAYADRIVVNTETHRKELSERYGKDTFVTIRNSFDEDDYQAMDTRRYDTFTIAHVGGIYGLRQPDVLFRAVKRLELFRTFEQLRLHVIFVGLNEPYLMDGITKYGVERYVKVLPMVSHHEAMEIMIRSHLLLLIKAIGPGSLGQIPGKFFEYMGSGNRILCIGPLESEVAGIMREVDAGYVVEDDENYLAEALNNEYDYFITGTTRRITMSDVERFGSEHMTGKMVELMWKGGETGFTEKH